MLENTNIKQFYPGPILNKTLDITDFLFKDPEQVHITYTYKNEDGSLSNRELTYGTEYEVAKILPSDVAQADAALTASTGKVTLKADLNVALGERLTIYRESEIIQETQYPRTGPFPAASHEGALDYLTMQNQEQQDQINRSLKVPISTANFDGALPIPVPARALKINSSGSGFELSEYDPDIALETTKEYMEGAQTAALNALASQNAAASSASSAANSEIAATQQANIATAKTGEVTETYNNAMADITTNKEQSMSAINENRISSIEEISNIKITAISDISTAGAEQVSNIKQTGFYMRDDKLYYVNSQGEETEFKSGGSGLELCDIGMALYVDETKGLRRYLNGQIVDINTNTQAFLNRLLQIKTTNPELFTTESNWQSEATLNIDGCVYKFVLNYNGDNVVSVRLPKYPNYVEINAGGTLPVVGNGISLGFTKGTSSRFNLQGDSNGTASFTVFQYGKPVGSSYSGVAAVNSSMGITDDPTKSGIQTTLKQTKLKMRYFIQIATGSETENNIINDIELNNPYSLFDSKYSDHELNNLSWLKSEGQWNAKAVYPDAYDKLLKVYNGTETVEGLSVKLSTEQYTDYDFVLNTADETFRLPLKTKLASGKAVVGNGMTLGLTDGTNLLGTVSSYGNNGLGVYNSLLRGVPATYGSSVGTSSTVSSDDNQNLSIGVTTDPTKSGIELSDSDLYLYFYVGETVQNANLIDAGRIGEVLANKQDKLSRYPIEISDKSLMPSWYVVYNDGWCEQGGNYNGGATSGTITLLKEYKDVKSFQIMTQCYFASSAYGYQIGVYNQYVNKFSWTASGSNYKFYWQASGYIR